MKTKQSKKMKTRRRRRPSPRRRPKPKSSVVTSRDIKEAAEGLRGIARRTPLLYVEELGAHLKLENEQPIGAFKIRGAYNAIRKLPEAARKRGVITFSSGNHGQAVAYAAKELGIRAVIVMPETTPDVKVAGVKKWGGEVVFAGRTSEDRRIKAEAIARTEQRAIVPPFDHPDLVARQATVPPRDRAVGGSHHGGTPRRRGATLANHGSGGQRRQCGSLASRGNRLMPGSVTRVLVADDDVSLVQTLTWILKENGYEVAVCPG